MTTVPPVQRIAQIFDEINRMHFDGRIPVPEFDLSTRMTRIAGQVCFDDWRWRMTISVPYHDAHGWAEELVDTVKHEAIHLYLFWTGRPSGHTKAFTELCQQIGATRWC